MTTARKRKPARVPDPLRQASRNALRARQIAEAERAVIAAAIEFRPLLPGKIRAAVDALIKARKA